MRCWYCDKKLGFFHSKKNLFCSPEHEELYKREQQELLVERVLGCPSDMPSVMGGPGEAAPAPAQSVEAQKKASRSTRSRQTALSPDSQPQAREKRVVEPPKDPAPADFLRIPIAVRSLSSSFHSDFQPSPELPPLSPQLPQVWLTPLPDPTPEPAAPEAAAPEPVKDTPPPLVERPIVAILLPEPKPEELHCQACDALPLEAPTPVRRNPPAPRPALALRLWRRGFSENRPPADTTHKLSIGRAIRRRTLVSAVALPSAPVAWRGNILRSLPPANQVAPVSLELISLPFTLAKAEFDPSTAALKPSLGRITQNSTFQPRLKALAGPIEWRALPQAHAGRLPSASRFEGDRIAIRPTLAFHDVAPSQLRIPESSVRPEADIMERILADCCPSDPASQGVISAGRSALHLPAQPGRSQRTGALEFLELVLGWTPAAQDFSAQTARTHREMETAPTPLLPSRVHAAAAKKSILLATCPARAEFTELSADPPPAPSAGAEVAVPAAARPMNPLPAPAESTLATGPLYGLPLGEPTATADVAVVTGQANATNQRIGLLPSIQPPPSLAAVLHPGETASIRCHEVDAAFPVTPAPASVPPASVNSSAEVPAPEFSTGLATGGIHTLKPIARGGDLQAAAEIVVSRVPAPEPQTPLAQAAFTVPAPRSATVERLSPGPGFAGSQALSASVPTQAASRVHAPETQLPVPQAPHTLLAPRSTAAERLSPGAGFAGDEAHRVPASPASIPAQAVEAGRKRTAIVSIKAIGISELLYKSAVRVEASPGALGSSIRQESAVDWQLSTILPSRYHDLVTASASPCPAKTRRPILANATPADTATAPVPSGTVECYPGALAYPPLKVASPRYSAPLSTGAAAASLPARDSSTPGSTRTGTEQSQPVALLLPPSKGMPARHSAPLSTGALVASLPAQDSSAPGIKTGAVKPRPAFDLVAGSGRRRQLGTCVLAALDRALNHTSVAVRPGDVAQTWTVAGWPMPGFSDAGVVGRLGTIAQTAPYLLRLAHLDRLPATDPWKPRETLLSKDQPHSRTNVPPVSLGNSQGPGNSLGLLPAPRPEHANVRQTGPGLAEKGEACLSCAAEDAGANSWLLRPADSSLALPLFISRNGHPHVPCGRPMAKHPSAEAAPMPAHIAKPLPRRRNLAFPVIRLAGDAPLDALMSALQTTP